MKRTFLAVGSLLALALSACAAPPTSTTPSASPSTTTQQTAVVACLVADPANAVANTQLQAGLDKAAEQLEVESRTTEIASSADYATTLQAQVDAGCTVVVATGTDSADPVQAAAKANPLVQFALVDVTPNSVPSNLRPVLFHTQDSAFLAGYAAAASSTTGTVGVFGALNIPAVTIYMDGFVQGVEKYNEVKGATVKVNGWLRERRSGTFVASSTDPWNDPAAGAAAASSLEADVVMTVAGASGDGVLNAAANSGTKVIWSDVDGCQTHADRCDQILGSVVKDRATALYELLSAISENRTASGVFVANLRNGGTAFVGVGDEALAKELDGLQQDIVDGRIDVASDSAIG